MVLVFGYELLPKFNILSREFTRAWHHSIVRVYIVIAQSRYNGDSQWNLRDAAVSEYFNHLVDGHLVEIVDFLIGSRDLDIVVVSCRVASPNHEIDLLFAHNY